MRRKSVQERSADRIRRFRQRQKRQRQHFFCILNTFYLFVCRCLMRNERLVWSLKNNRSVTWWDTCVPMWSDRTWRENFRVSRQTFQYLCNNLRPSIERQNTTMRVAIDVERRVALTLYRLATHMEYRSIGNLFGVARSTVCEIFNEVCKAITEVLMPLHLCLPNQEQLRQIVEGFEAKWGFPQCCGAVDGTHIPIVAPNYLPVDYYNRKGYYSYNMQGIVDHKYRFIDISIECPGSVHDARAFSLSPISIVGEQGNLFPDRPRYIGGVDVPLLILGDSAYPLLTWLMKPFNDNGRLTPAEKRFNYRLSRARMVVENAYGRLKGRWRILLKRFDNNYLKVPTVIAACCTLHNICETMDNVEDNDVNLPLDGDELPQPDQPRNGVENGRARDIRNALMQYFDS